MNCAERLIAHFEGNIAEAGRRVGTSRQMVHAWKVRGAIPVVWASKVDAATAGVVTRMQILEEQELRGLLRKRGS